MSLSIKNHQNHKTMSKIGQAALVIDRLLKNSDWEPPRTMAMITPDYLFDLIYDLIEDKPPEYKQTVEDAWRELSYGAEVTICSRLKDDLYGDIVAAHYDRQA